MRKCQIDFRAMQMRHYPRHQSEECTLGKIVNSENALYRNVFVMRMSAKSIFPTQSRFRFHKVLFQLQNF